MDENNIEFVEVKWEHCDKRMPEVGQKVQVRHTILSEMVWDGKRFVLPTGSNCDPHEINRLPNHEIVWRVKPEEEK